MSSSTRPRPPAVVVDPHPFVGRRAELAALAAVESVDLGVVLVGEPGIGTTRLAREWASRACCDLLVLDVADGSCPLRRALRALGAPRVPDEPGARIGLLRSLLRARPVPVVLDGVSTEAQARAFPTGSAPVIVTTRHRLPGLAVDGWRHVPVPELDPDDSAALLAAGTGRDVDERQALGGVPAVLRLAFGVDGLPTTRTRYRH